MATGYFNISYSGKNKRLGSSTYKYNLRLDNGRTDLVAYGFYNIPSIYNVESTDKRFTLLEYYYDLEKYSRKNAVLSINFIAMIPREFSTKYKDNDLYKLYTDIGNSLTKRLADNLSDDIKHIGTFAIHNIISSSDGEVQPHIHLQISSRGYKDEDINSTDMNAYNFIEDGIYNEKLQDIETYYDSRKIFVNVMNEYLVQEGFEERFSEKSLSSKLTDLDINSDVVDIIKVLREDVLRTEGLNQVDIHARLSNYDDMISTYNMYKDIQNVIDSNKENMDIVSKVKDLSVRGDDYLLHLMDKRNRIFNKILNFDEELYRVNGDLRYKSYILARESGKGLYVEDYLDVDKVIVKEDINNNLKEYYKIGHMGNLMKKLSKNISDINLEKYGFKYLGLEDINTTLSISNLENMIVLSKNMDELNNIKSEDYVIGDKPINYTLDVSKDLQRIENKYVNMLVNMIECDVLIQIGLSERPEDNLIKQVFDGKNISSLTIDDNKTLSEHIDENILIFDEFTYSSALNVLRELEKQLKELSDKEDEESKELFKKNYEYFMKLKGIITSDEIKNKISKLKKDYQEYVSKLNELKQDEMKRTNIQNIVNTYKLNYIKSQEDDGKLNKLMDRYENNEKIQNMRDKKTVQDLGF